MSGLSDIEAFVQVVDCGGFGRAAERLGISKSIVSRRIARLEAELGVPLLSRNTRGVSPTEAGLEFKARSERILAELDEARDSVAQRGGDVVGRLRVALPMAFGIRHVAPVLAELAIRHPRLQVDAAYGEGFVDLIAERFDAAVRIGDLKDSSLVARRIAPIRTVVVASPGYLAAHGRPRQPAELTGHQCLAYTGRRDSEGWKFRVGKRWLSIRPEGRFRADSGDAVLAAAVAGLGIAAVPTFLASAAIQGGAVEPLLTDFEMPAFGLFVVRPPGAQVPGKVRALIDLLVERFGGEPYWDPCQMAGRPQ